MSTVQVVFWRDIPAQIKVREGRDRLSRPLSLRFQEAIDSAAMRAGASGTDAYLAEWRNSDLGERDGTPEAVAQEVGREFEAAYSDERLGKLIEQGGKESG